MFIVYSYMMWSYFLVFFVSALFLIFFLMSFQMFKVVGWMLSQEGSFQQVILTTSSFILSSLPLAFPLALFFSAIYCAGKWSGSSEYTALRSIGFSLKKILLPISSIALLVGLLLFILYWELIPSGRAYGRKIVAEIQSKAMLAQMQSGNFFTQIPKLLFFAEKIDSTTYKMENVFIYQDAGSKEEKIIFSSHGHLIIADSENKSASHMKLWNGDIIIRDEVNNRMDKLSFKQLDYALPPLDYYFDVSIRPNFLAWNALGELKSKIPNLLERREIDLERKVDIYSEKIERVWQSVLCLFFAIIGFLCGLGHFRQSSKFKSFLAFIVLIIYFSTFYFLNSLAKKEVVHYLVPYILSFLILTVISIYLKAKQKWVLGS
jgi:lipopolysaccharide export LptBFGC system permease protein LptF